MNNKLWTKGALMGAGVFLSHMAFTSPAFSPPAQAQPDLNNAPKGDNPPERERRNRENNNNRNPEEGIRRMMAQAGVDNVGTQDAVLAYMRADSEARRPLREQGMKLFQALRAGAVTDDQLLALVTDYRAAQQAERVRRDQAQLDLDAKIKYSQNPRLESMLLLSGLIGEGGGMMMMPMMRGGFGRQQGQGGNQQGQGGNAQNREERQKRMLERFDANKDGKLDAAEEETMREKLRDRREQRKDDDAKPAAGQPAGAAMQEDDA